MSSVRLQAGLVKPLIYYYYEWCELAHGLTFPERQQQQSPPDFTMLTRVVDNLSDQSEQSCRPRGSRHVECPRPIGHCRRKAGGLPAFWCFLFP